MPELFSDPVHADNVLQRMWEQCENEQLYDVVLIGANDEMRVPAHRAVLSASSEYFKGMFMSSMSESVSKEVKLSTGDGYILKSLIQFCYTGRVEIDEDVAEELLKMADYFSLEFVVNACATFLTKKLSPTNCLGFALFAEQYRCQPLLNQSIDYSLKHFPEVNKTDEFLNLSAELLGKLLASDKLRASAENDVYESLKTWINHDSETREKYKEGLLKFVRMPLIEPSFLIDHLKLCTTVSFESHQLLQAVEWHLLPERRTLHAGISPKLRTPDSILIAITKNKPVMYIHYYCPKQLKWMKCLKELPYRSDYAVTIMNDKMYIVGGGNDANNYLITIMCLNFKTMIMEEVKSMKECRRHPCAAVLNECLYALGGFNGSYLNSVEKWDAKTNTWSNAASMSFNRSHFCTAFLNDKLYVVGGYSNSGLLRSAEYYDLHQNKWVVIESMIYGRYNHAVTVANGFLYAVGGAETSTAEYYDPRIKKWTAICSLTAQLDSPKSCITFNNKVLVFYKDRVEEYDPVTNKWKVNKTFKGLIGIDCIFHIPASF